MLYAIDGEKLTKQDVKEFSELGLKERGDLQRLLPPTPQPSAKSCWSSLRNSANGRTPSGG